MIFQGIAKKSDRLPALRQLSNFLMDFFYGIRMRWHLWTRWLKHIFDVKNDVKQKTMITGFFLIIENLRIHSLINLNNHLFSQKRLLDNVVSFA